MLGVDPPNLARALGATLEAFLAPSPPVTADHFYSPALLPTPPAWADDAREVAVEGSVHRFFLLEPCDALH